METKTNNELDKELRNLESPEHLYWMGYHTAAVDAWTGVKRDDRLDDDTKHPAWKRGYNDGWNNARKWLEEG